MSQVNTRPIKNMNSSVNLDDEYTQDGSVDIHGKPSVKNKSGNWKACPFILGNECCERLAYYGINTNMVMYLRKKFMEGNATAANNVTNWSGTCYITPLIGAFIADAYWGRYKTIAVFSIVYFFGMTLLTISASVPKLKPPCKGSDVNCHPTTGQTGVFFLSIYIIALGTGGIKPCVSSFGADQFDETDVVEKKKKSSFFNWFYFSINIGALIASSVLVWVQTNVGWEWGFGIPTVAMGIAVCSFFSGTRLYRHQKPGGSPLTRIAQVLVASFRKWNTPVPRDKSGLYEVQDKESVIEGSRKLEHTDGFRFLDKAAVETVNDKRTDGYNNPWKLCTVTQVEELKAVVRILPIWASGIIFATVYSQMSTLFVEQGDTMDISLTVVEIEPGFRRELSAIMASDLMTKYHDGTTKIDADETAGEERHLRHKRTKYHLQGSPVTSTAFSPGFLLHPFEETSPLGLTLKKTPSFIELIQMSLSEGDSAAPLAINNSSLEVGRKNESKCAPGPGIADKYKASNFPALVLRIGSWERISRYEGDLVVKCYDAKRKLVWEVLEGGLKSKMEIHWSDITSLKTSCPDNEPGTLEIEVSRRPLFFRETDPQPRKHTVWQATSDFTGGQASKCRRHLLQFAQGRLQRYHEKLLQCEHQLNLLRKEGIMSGDCRYFDSSGEVFQDQNEHRCYGATYEQKSQLFLESDHLTDNYFPPFWSLPDRITPGVSSMVQKIEPPEMDGRVLDAAPQDTPSPCSASVTMDSWATEESGITSDDDLHVNATANCEQMIFVTPYGGLRNQGCDLLSPKSMDLLPVNETVSCSSEKKGFHNSVPTIEETWQANKRILDDIADHLLGDSLLSATFDEQNVIAHINSMCSVIENDVSALHASNGNTESLENSGAGRGSGRLAKGEDDGQVYEINDHMTGAGLSRDDRLNSHVMEDDYILCRQSSGFLRQDSLADLAVNIPWIASFPQLFDDYSDQFIMSAEQTGIAGWKLFE